MGFRVRNREFNAWYQRIYIAASLLRFGLLVNLKNGQLIYWSYMPECKCKKLQVLRHGKTVAVEKNEFMSNSSKNSRLAYDGIREIERVAQEIKKSIPDVILLAPLERTVQTFHVLQSQITEELPVKRCPYLLGINNGSWEEKSFEKLDSNNLYVFLQRECAHNIFAKTRNGDSWGDVLVRCCRLLREMNREYKGKEVLLISQGSIYQGLKMLLHQQKTPWEGYSADSMFCTGVSKEKPIGYGRIFDVC